MKNIVLIILVLIVNGCSSTFTGPVTGNKYNIDVGCTEDMQQYREERKEVIDKKKQEKQKIELDCPVTVTE